MELAGSPASSVWQTEIGIERLPYLADHCVQGSVVVPATAYVEMAAAAARDFFGDRPVRLSELDFQKPLVLSAGAVHSVQVSFTSIDSDHARVDIHSRPATGSGAWTRHAVAKAGNAGAQPATSMNQGAFDDFVRGAPMQIGGSDFYHHFSSQGNQWGPTFRGVTAAWAGREEAWTRVEIPASLQAEIGMYRAHPAVADACQHVLCAIDAFGSGKSGQPGAFVGEGIDSVTIWHPLRAPHFFCYARVRPGPKPNVFLGDVRVFDPSGNLISDLQGARLRSLESRADAGPENWFYRIAWRDVTPKERALSERSHWIILTDRSGLGDALTQRMSSAGVSSTRIRSQGAEAFRELEENLAAHSIHSTRVVCLWGLDVSVGENTPGDDAIREIVLSRGVPALLTALASSRMLGTRVWLVTRGAQACEGAGRSVAFWQAPLWGLGRTFAVERADLWGGLIDLDPQFDSEADADALWGELRTAGNEDQIALRGDRRLAARLEPQSVRPLGPPPFRSDSAYLVTGGLGGLGLEIARWMAGAGAGHIVLMSRTALPERADWGRVQPGDPQARAIRIICAMEQNGAVVHTVPIDVSDEAAVSGFVESWQPESRPPIRGVVHAAGTLLRSSIATMSAMDLEAVLRPKLGGWLLHRALEQMPLDFFVLFSSASSVLSCAKLAAYAAANSLLDGLAAYRNQAGKPGLSINWDLWTEAGMATTFASSEIQALSERGMGGLSTAAGLEVFASLIRASGQTAVLPVNRLKWASRYPAYMRAPMLSNLFDVIGAQSAAVPPPSVRQQIVESGAPDQKRILSAYLAGALEKILGFPTGGIDPSIRLTQLGLDSLTGIELKNRIDADLGVSLPMVRFLEGPPLDTLAVELLEALERENIATAPKPGAAYSDAALLANLDRLTEAEIDAALGNLMHAERW
jgi:NAD(P)-dependent dehydrogenase (short-subunit alcohol dehydrogenase family)